MPRKIVIHAGFHKTGTSTIQQILRKNRPLLKTQMAIRLKPQMKDLIHATRGFSTWRDPVSFAKTEQRFEALLRGLPGMPKRVLCLSAEELSGHMPGRGDLIDYSAAPILMHLFAQVSKRVFPRTGVTFCFGVRTSKAWLRSAWAEHVKSSSMILDFSAFEEAYSNAANFGKITNDVADLTECKVTAIALDEHRDNLAAPLLSACDIPNDLISRLCLPSPVNERLPDAVLLDLLGANRAYADRNARKAAKQRILGAAGL